MMNLGKGSIEYLLIILVLFGLSVSAAYYRYMVRQDFTYFITADQIPSQFDLSSYSKL